MQSTAMAAMRQRANGGPRHIIDTDPHAPALILPISAVPALGGVEVFLRHHSKTFICYTDARGKVTSMAPYGS